MSKTLQEALLEFSARWNENQIGRSKEYRKFMDAMLEHGKEIAKDAKPVRWIALDKEENDDQ